MAMLVFFHVSRDLPQPSKDNPVAKAKAQKDLTLFKAANDKLFDTIDKLVDDIGSDMCAIDALAAQEEYPEKEICEALQTLYAHVHAMKLNVAILDELLDDESDEVIKSADFMDKYIEIIVNAMGFIDDAESELDALLLGI